MGKSERENTIITIGATFRRETDNFLRWDILLGDWKDKQISGQIYVRKDINLTELKIKFSNG